MNRSKVKRALLGILISAGIGGIPLSAQTLSEKEAIEKALAHHPDIRAMSLRVGQSAEGCKSARADYLPQISLQGEYDPQRTYVLPVNGTFHTRDDDGWSVGGALHQKLWDFEKTLSLINAAETERKIAELGLADAKGQTVYRVRQLYALMVVQRMAVEVRRKDMEAKKALYEQAEALVKQGLKTEADASRFLSAYYVAKDNLGIAEASFDKARTTLSLFIGEPIAPDVRLQKDVISADAADTLNDGNVEKRMLDNSPQLKMLDETVRRDILMYHAAKEAHYGSIDAYATYVDQDTLNRYDATVVGITATIPLYSGGRISAQAQQARIGAEMAKAQRDSKELALRQELEGLLIDLRRFEKTLAARKAQYEAAQEARQLLEARYREGLATYIEVLDATAQTLAAQLGLLEARYNRSDALNRIDYLTGKQP